VFFRKRKAITAQQLSPVVTALARLLGPIFAYICKNSSLRELLFDRGFETRIAEENLRERT
jgi:hypothetical protein